MEKENRWIYPKKFRQRHKSWSIKLLNGSLSKNPGHVMAKRCESCRFHTPKFVASVIGDPSIQLHGCELEKCIWTYPYERVLIKVKVRTPDNPRQTKIRSILQDIAFQYRLIEPEVEKAHRALTGA